MSVRLVFTSHGDPASTFQVPVSRVPASLHLSRDLNRAINNVAETSPKARWAEPGRNPSGNVDAALFHWKGSKLWPNLSEAWSTSSKSHLENVSLQDFYSYCLKTNIAERPQATYWNGCGFNPRWVLGILGISVNSSTPKCLQHLICRSAMFAKITNLPKIWAP